MRPLDTCWVCGNDITYDWGKVNIRHCDSPKCAKYDGEFYMRFAWPNRDKQPFYKVFPEYVNHGNNGNHIVRGRSRRIRTKLDYTIAHLDRVPIEMLIH